MNVRETTLPGVLLLEPRIFPDHRGHFAETWNRRRYAEIGIAGEFVQDNLSVSNAGVLRGLHYQVEPHAQAKLISVLSGTIWDVVVDLRAGSETFGAWEGNTLAAAALQQLYVPAGFAHGFAVLSETATVSYKCDAYHHPASERTLLWSDPDLAIPWPLDNPLLSEKDRAGRTLRALLP
jgi:dTDP-4-dehydrorhamnose 3,5-epimerase